MPKSMPMTYLGSKAYSISISAGAMMAASCLAPSAGKSTLAARHPLCRRMPPDGGLAGTLPDELDRVGIAGGRLGESALHAVDHRLEGDVTRDRIAALIVEFAHRRAHLVVGVAGDILHQKIDQARIALHDAENLQGAVGGPAAGCAGAEAGGLGGFRRRRGSPRRASSSSLSAASESFP